MPSEDVTLYASWEEVFDISMFIEDEGLEEVIRQHLGVLSGPISQEDANYLYLLKAHYQNIESLEGIQYFTNLRSVDLSNNQITDLSPLTELPNLHTFILSNNKISDLSALLTIFEGEFDSLIGFIRLSYNPLDLSITSETYEILTKLVLKGYHIEINDEFVISKDYFIKDAEDEAIEVSLDSEESRQFTTEHLYDWFKVTITDEETISLLTEGFLNTDIDVYSNDFNLIDSVSNTRCILNLDAGTYYILIKNHAPYFYSDYDGNYTFHINRVIEDENSPIVDFTNSLLEGQIRNILNKEEGVIRETDLLLIDYFNVRYVQLSEEDYSIISKMKNLNDLRISNSTITDLSFIENLTQLESLFLMSNSLSDISSLSSLNNLKRLSVIWNDVSDISPLSSLTNLVFLDLYDNDISDISPLLTMVENGCFAEDSYNNFYRGLKQFK